MTGEAAPGNDAGSVPGRNPATEPAVDPESYLNRLGFDPATVDTPDLNTLARLQRAHVTMIPFENLSIVGDPESAREGAGVTLSVPHLYEKIVERERGGYCYELNGLFHSLLAALGYEVDRVAARITSGDGVTLPANHHSNVVTIDRRYVVDVGMGVPTMRQPLPLDGEERIDEVGVTWRVTGCDRPDDDLQTEYREPGDEEWTRRYVFSHEPREFSYFEATNDYLQTAPESGFTGDPIVTIATDEGHRKLSDDTLTEYVGNETRDSRVGPEEFHATLEGEFGLRLDGDGPV